MLNVKFNYLDLWTKKRQENANNYNALFGKSGLQEKGDVITPRAIYRTDGNSSFHIYNQYVIRAKRRDELQNHLKQIGIGTEIYYPIPFHVQECFSYLGYKEGEFPEAEHAAKETLALPIYPGLTSDQQNYIVGKITEYYLN